MIRQATWNELLFLCKAMGYHPSGNAKAIVLLKDGELQASAVYDRWTYSSCEIHTWTPKAFSRQFLKEAFRYPFEVANCDVVIGVTPEGKEALETARRLGFIQKYRIKDGWKKGIPLVIQEMRKEDCRWIRRAA